MTDGRLASEGGTPVRPTLLPFHRSWIDEAAIQEVAETLRSGWLTRGPRTARLEAAFREYVGAHHAVGLNSCTAGLHLALAALGIGSGDEVITTPFTFAATANVIVHLGARPVFVDVEPDTLNLDATKIASALTGKTKALLPVHFAGQPCEMDEIVGLARSHGLAVVEDAAHALEAAYRRRKIGTLGSATVFSFYATKNMTTGEGGMLTTDDEPLAEQVRTLSLHGLSQNAWRRYAEPGFHHYEVIAPGYKYNMFDIQAALGLHQLWAVEKWWEIRERYVRRYDEAFAPLTELSPLQVRSDRRSAHHLYVVLLHLEHLSVTRDRFAEALLAENIGIGIHFRSLHLHPYYRDRFGYAPDDYPVARWASDRVLSLPLYPKMTAQDVEDVIRAVLKVLRAFPKRRP